MSINKLRYFSPGQTADLQETQRSAFGDLLKETERPGSEIIGTADIKGLHGNLTEIPVASSDRRVEHLSFVFV